MTESILLTIQNHAEWAWLIVFLIAFIESLAIVGLLMPGWVLLVGIGGLIGTDILQFFPIALSAYMGAVLGEYLSYYVGYHYHEVVLNWKFVARHQLMIERTKEFFQKHGAAGVFFGRFIGPVRAVIPLVAGISEMPKRTFFWVNLTSGLIWAPLYLIPGILIGAAFELENEILATLFFIVLLIGFVLWMAFNQSVKLYKILKGQSDRNRQYAMLNSTLSWTLVFVLLIVVAKSEYSVYIGNILEIVLGKIY